MIEKLITLSQFLVGISIIVGIHELGHMLIAKMFGIRVEHYMIGFPPKLFKFQWGETEYALGAIPLGGSAKIAGMVDESFDTKGLKSDPQPWEYRSKPTWQRLLVVLGGIIFNMVSGILIFILLLYHDGGGYYISKESMNEFGIYPTELGKKMGFKEGDKILKINGKQFSSLEETQNPGILLKKNVFYTISRNQKNINIYLTKEIYKNISNSSHRNILFEPRVKYKIVAVDSTGNAKKAGLQSGDQIISINQISAIYIQDLKNILQKFKSKRVSLNYYRNNNQYTTIVAVSEEGKIGIKFEPQIKKSKHHYTLSKSITKGSWMAFNVVWSNILAIKHMIIGNLSVSKSLKGPIGIISVFGGGISLSKFWYIVAFLSMMIAFTNLLPIPVLDGGHAIFVLFEMITGKKVSEKIMLRLQIIGSAFFLLIILYTIINDIIKLFY